MRMVTDLMGWDLIFLFMPYGEFFNLNVPLTETFLKGKRW